MLSPDKEVELRLRARLTRLKRQQMGLQRVKRALGLTQSLSKTINLVNQSRMGCSRHTGRHRRCLKSKGTASSMWRRYGNDAVVMSNISIWRSGGGTLSWEDEIPLRQEIPYTVDGFKRHSRGQLATPQTLTSK